MKLLVEAGSTKTDSLVLFPDGGRSTIHKSKGINPVTDPDHTLAIDALLAPYRDLDINLVMYYGSGCIGPEVNDPLAHIIADRLPSHPDVHIHDDLIAVGHGLCPAVGGIIGILGTGSNIGYFDSFTIIDRVKSCGYLLGDEGSGFRIGQAVYRMLCRDQLPATLIHQICESEQIHQRDLITSLYSHTNPRTYIASFARYVKDIPSDVHTKVMDEVFGDFITRMVKPLHDRHGGSVYLSGSIAFHFQEVLLQKLRKNYNIAATFAPSPLEGLIRYHRYEQ